MNRLLVINLSAVRIDCSFKRDVLVTLGTCDTGRAGLVSKQLSEVKKGEVKRPFFPPPEEQYSARFSAFRNL